jgi:hypothetical protein
VCTGRDSTLRFLILQHFNFIILCLSTLCTVECQYYNEGGTVPKLASWTCVPLFKTFPILCRTSSDILIFLFPTLFLIFNPFQSNFSATRIPPALIHFGRERGWWVTCNYPTVLKEKNINRNRKSTTFVRHYDFPVPDAFPHVVRTSANRKRRLYSFCLCFLF